jgi:hypothetical protein
MEGAMAWVRRNLLLILFGLLIVGQVLTWRAIVGMADNIDHFGCGTRTIPCKVIVLPDR